MVNEIIDNISTQLDSVKEYGQSLVLQGSETSPLTSCTLIQRFADRRSNAEPLAPMQSGNCIEIPGVPVRLMQPYGWSCRADGIYKDEAGKLQTLICRTPIVLTRRLCSTGGIDEQIEIAFFRDGKWKFASFLRSVLFSARHVVDLADLGCTVTSSHSKDLVEYFGALEAENIDLIPKVSVATYFGWQPSAGFLPGHAGDVVLNPDLSTLGSAICQLGTLEEWVKQMAAYRSNPVFRAVLSAGFAAPLLRIVNQRSFFVHNWGNSRSGKTAALKAALSAWGDPDKLMVNFNATPVGLERTAAIYHDLPLGVDERQLAGTNQDEIEKIVYMLSNGIGKTRGTKTGGVQPTAHWRTVVLSTGEEPIISSTSQNGVGTRVLELYGSPFDSEADAGAMHQHTAHNYGWAGPAFVDRVMALHEKMINNGYDLLYNSLRSISDGKNMALVAETTVLALADAMIDSWFFADCDDGLETPIVSEQERILLADLQISSRSWSYAKRLAAYILQRVQAETIDVNEIATQYIADWILSNRQCFDKETSGSSYGFFADDNKTVYIFPSRIDDVLKKNGYNTMKTKHYLFEHGLIQGSVEKSGKRAFSVVKNYNGGSHRFLAFNLEKYISSQTEMDANYDVAQQTGSE